MSKRMRVGTRGRSCLSSDKTRNHVLRSFRLADSYVTAWTLTGKPKTATSYVWERLLMRISYIVLRSRKNSTIAVAYWDWRGGELSLGIGAWSLGLRGLGRGAGHTIYKSSVAYASVRATLTRVAVSHLEKSLQVEN